MFLMRHGVCMEQMTMAQRDAALLLMQESLSPAGYESARNIMKDRHAQGPSHCFLAQPLDARTHGARA